MSLSRCTARTCESPDCPLCPEATTGMRRDRAALARRTPRKRRIRTGVRILSMACSTPLPARPETARLPCMRRALVVLGGFAVAAASAPAAVASVTAVELTPGSDRALASRGAESPFTLAGIHWRGPGQVLFRTRSLDGRWRAWRPAAPEDEDGPDSGSREVRLRKGWRIGNPWWVGPSDRIETRTAGSVSRVRAYLVRSPELRVPNRVLAGGGGGDRQGDPALPREGERLERHRLQLPRRPLRDGVRGAVRRHRAQRRWSARAWLQHRIRRDRRPGDVRRRRPVGGGPEGGCESHRVASRPRPRRSGRPPDVHLGRKRALPERCAGAPPRGVGP